jgi:hypothetical protein
MQIDDRSAMPAGRSTDRTVETTSSAQAQPGQWREVWRGARCYTQRLADILYITPRRFHPRPLSSAPRAALSCWPFGAPDADVLAVSSASTSCSTSCLVEPSRIERGSVCPGASRI